MLQLDDLDPGDVFTEDAVVSAARVELALPRQQDAIAQPVLQHLELGGELRMQQRGDAVGLGVVDRPIEEEIGVGTQPLMAALLPRDRVVPGDPDPQAAVGELIAADPTAGDMNRVTVDSDASAYASSASAPLACDRCASQVPSSA